MNQNPTMLSNEEYTARILKFQKLMQSNKFGGLIATLGVNFQYLFKSRAQPSERLTVVVLPAKGEPSLITPFFEKQNMINSTPIAPENIVTWEETEDPVKKLVLEWEERGLKGSRIVLTPETPFTTYSKIKIELSNELFIDGHDLFKEARICKTETEIKLLKLAAEHSAKAIEKVLLNDLKEGITEIFLSNKVSQELTSLSGEPAQFAIVQFGKNTAVPHGAPTEKKLRTNEPVLIDAGTTVQGYFGDITNTTFYGDPSKEFIEIYDIVEEANQTGVQAAREKNSCESVDKETRAIIENQGYGQYFTHRTGHGIGLEVHEDPYIVSGNENLLKVNQVHSVEPGIYILNKFGIRIEDDVIVGTNSGSRAANVNRRLWQKF